MPQPETQATMTVTRSSPEITILKPTASLLAPGGPVIAQRYRVLREIARGGMGAVIEAQHIYTKRSVALKLLLPEWSSSPEALARFHREAVVLGSIQHPGVVAILDAGEDAVSGRYLVMEHLVGRSLDGLLMARSRLDGPSVARLGAQIADALIEVHRVGVVHRDIKPSNLFLCVQGGRGEQVKLIDFGIAAQMGTATQLSDDGWKTAQGSLLGTAGYMPAEQILGRATSEKHDVYGLGATLYECLTGEPPHDGETTDVLARVLAGVPPPSLRKRRPDLSPMLVETIERALAHRPENRPSCEELRTALTACSEAPPAAALLRRCAPHSAGAAPGISSLPLRDEGPRGATGGGDPRRAHRGGVGGGRAAPVDRRPDGGRAGRSLARSSRADAPASGGPSLVSRAGNLAPLGAPALSRALRRLPEIRAATRAPVPGAQRLVTSEQPRGGAEHGPDFLLGIRGAGVTTRVGGEEPLGDLGGARGALHGRVDRLEALLRLRR